MSYWMSIIINYLAAYAPRWGPKSVIFKAFWRFDVVRAEADSCLSGELSWGFPEALWGALGGSGKLWEALGGSGKLAS